MDNVTTHECFPTLIHEFKLDLDHDKMLDYVYSTGETRGQIHQTHANLHKVQVFKPLVDELVLLHDSILQKLEYEYSKTEITNMWANRLCKPDSHAPHTHSNNFFSGVYYLLGGKNKTAPIQFFDPRAQTSILVPRRKNSNWNNSNILQFDSVSGTGFIFPSWLMHWVPSANVTLSRVTSTQHERISVSWNVFVRGHYGEPKTLQNAYI